MSIFKGTRGDDILSGGSGNDIFRLWQGGDDTVNGGGGNDLFKFGAAFTAADKIDGGTGNDTVALKGDYSPGVIFNADTMVNVETIKLIGNFSYNLTTNDATVAAGQTLTINARGLGTGHTLTFDGSNESDGSFTVLDSGGNDVITGGDQRDHINISAGGNDTVHGGGGDDLIYAGTKFTAADHIDGGSGFDTVLLDGMGAASSITFGAATLTNVERLSVLGGHSYNLTTNGANVTSGHFLEVDASRLGAGDTLTFNGSAETNGYYVITGGAGNDVITGGQDGDIIDLSHGGNDTVTLGSTLHAFPNEVYMGAALTAADQLDGTAGFDFVTLDGDYTGAHAVVFNATTMVDIEDLVVTAGHSYDLTSNDGNVGAGDVMQVDGSSLGVSDSLEFDGSAETDGAFDLIDGLGNDVLKGGAGADILSFDGGGTDTGIGGGGDDFIDACGHFDSTDHFDGGIGFDQIELTASDAGPNGYAGANALVLTASMMSNIEQMDLDPFGNYDITTADGNVAAGASLTVDASILDSGDSLIFNGAAETDGSFIFQLDASTYALTGGAQDDTFYVHAGFTNADSIDGGGATTITGNAIEFDGDYSGANALVFSATAFQNIQSLRFDGGHSYDFTLNDANVASGATLIVDGTTLTASDSLTFDASAETDGTLTFYDGAGDDVLTGGQATNYFDMTGGGTDTVKTAFSFTGHNYIYMGSNLTAADTIQGNVGYDQVTLDGDYSGANAVVFTATTMTGIDDLVLKGGHSYDLTTNDATVDSLTNPTMTVDSTDLGVGDTLKFDGSAETDSNFTFNAGLETDTLTGGAFADTFNMGAGLTAADKIDGGGGIDTLNLDGDYSAGLTISDTYVNNIEDLTFAAGHSYNITISGDITDPTTLTIDGSALGASDSLTLDLTAATSSGYTITGGAGDDTITGPSGTAGMSIDLSKGGVDTVTGGGGDDTINFGTTLWSDDQVDGGGGTDTVHVSGFSGGDSIVFGANTLTNVEKLVIDSGGNGLAVTTDDNTVASGQTLSVDASAANGFTFDGSAELDGNFDIKGSAGDDVLIGGAQADTFEMGANLTPSDKIDGGAGTDTVTLTGMGAADAIVFTATTMINVENLVLGDSTTYTLVTDDATVAAGAELTIDATALTAGHNLEFDGAAETNGVFDILAGDGTYLLTGGAQDDTFEMGAHFSGSDAIDGGAGYDIVTLNGNYSPSPTFTPITFNASTITGIEEIDLLGSGNAYHIVMNNGNVASGQTLLVDATASGGLWFEGDAELDGSFFILSSTNGNSDTVSGGQQADTIDVQAGSLGFYRGNGGNDTFNISAVTLANNNISGDAGDDIINVYGTVSAAIQLTGGANDDTFNLNGNFNSNVTILGGSDNDTLALAGDYSGGTTLSSAKISSLENITLADGHTYNLTVTGDLTSATGQLTIDGSAVSSNGMTLDLTGATSGSYAITGGASDDTFNFGTNFSGSTSVDGGAGSDTLGLSGGGDILFGPTAFTSVETLKFSGGSYDVGTNDANVASGATLAIDASALTVGQSLTFGGTAETDGFFAVTGGAGSDTVVIGNTAVLGGSSFDGGAGSDTLELSGAFASGATISDSNFHNIETVTFDSGHSYKITISGDITDPTTLAINGSALGASDVMTLDLTTATSSAYTITGGAANDVVTLASASALLNSSINLGAGSDTLILDGDFTVGGGVSFGNTTVQNVETIQLTDGNSYYLGLSGNTVATGGTITVDGSALTAGHIMGMSFDTTGGGDSTYIYKGGAGDDVFVMLDAFTANDQLNGGAGSDEVSLDGDYSAGVTLNASTITNVETLILVNGFSYKLTMADGNVAAGQTLTVLGNGMASGEVLTFDGSAETNGSFFLSTGAGDDLLTGGSQADTFDLSHGGNDTAHGGGGNDEFDFGGAFTSADTVDGGSGSDTLDLNGNYPALTTIAATAVTSIETLKIEGSSVNNLAVTGDITSGGGTLAIDASATTSNVFVDLSGATTTNFNYTGGAGSDFVTFGGNFKVSDQINGGAGAGYLFLDGDYSGVHALVFNASTITNIQQIDVVDGFNYDITLNAGNVTGTNSIGINPQNGMLTGTLNVDASAFTTQGLEAAGGDSADTLIGGGGYNNLQGGGGNDILNSANGSESHIDGGAGQDTITVNAATEQDFTFSGGVSDSTSSTFDIIHGLNFGEASFDIGHTVNGIDAAINTGTLDTGVNFDTDLAAVVDSGHLGIGDAVLFTVSASTTGLTGHTFLVVDMNGAAGYQASQDLVMDVTGYTGTLVTGNFF